ncbi:uncharacterized protein si:ch1073-358c10.1 isoform X2 [Toxotes jaculatrix]|uniref:uncharacterized protein si:ch1073-358c10.1 isoform X2 n=1 Tax=Toxotes jaculatrix TaxID=941984 RepID=UPI001B3AC7A1|nr:uncharacterized protein si:ch1073-358c10.1 isoform X2 [Toxotes jaculatrix]
MEASRKTQPFPQLFSQTQIHTVWHLLVLVSLVAADTMSDKTQLPSRDRALKGREEKMVVADKHAANGNPTVEPFPEGMETIMFGMGCFWGAERLFWRIPGVFSTQVGYAGGFTPNPTYHEKEMSQDSRDPKMQRKTIKKQSRKGCFKYSALSLSPPSLHLQSTTQNVLLQMGCTPPSPPPHDLLVRIGLCTVLYCGVFANRGYCV